MSCKTCGAQSRPLAPLALAPAGVFVEDANNPSPMVTANTSHTTLKTGMRVSLRTLFIASTARPRGGWKVKLLLPGQIHAMEFDGKTAQAVFSQVKAAVVNNSITMSDESIWLNLNMVWMDRVDQKFWLLLRNDLASLVQQEDAPAKQTPGLILTPPTMWGSRGWQAMGILLASNSFQWSLFLSVVKEVLSLLNPVSNPITGCQECYVEFSREVGRLETSGALSREQAREWLFEFHNKVNTRIGKPTLTRAQAWGANFWQ